MGIISKVKEKAKEIYYIAKEKIKKAIVKVKNALTHFFE